MFVEMQQAVVQGTVATQPQLPILQGVQANLSNTSIEVKWLVNEHTVQDCFKVNGT